MTEISSRKPHTISVVIPVYQGEKSLPALLDELASHFRPTLSADGHAYTVSEVLLVHDHGPDGSADVIRALAQQHPQVRPVWLSRNFGQHPATLAGMASSGSEWIITMDEDGQHDPAHIPDFLDVALRERATLVYSAPTNAAPHGFLRNAASSTTKSIARHLLKGEVAGFQSYRLVLGEIGRSVAAYAGAGVFLDVAMSWVNPAVAYCPVVLRDEGERRSGYSTRRLLSHFWQMVISSGTRGLRVVAMLGVLLGVIGVLLAVYVVVAKATGHIHTPGWSSMVVVELISSGLILVAIGVIAEYVGVAVNMAMGKPLYLITTDTADGPLGRR